MDPSFIASTSDNYYDILGVTMTATNTDINKAYKRRALQCHPDRVPVSDQLRATATFQRLLEAFETLNSESKRSAYDLKLSSERVRLSRKPSTTTSTRTRTRTRGQPAWSNMGSTTSFTSSSSTHSGFSSTSHFDETFPRSSTTTTSSSSWTSSTSSSTTSFFWSQSDRSGRFNFTQSKPSKKPPSSSATTTSSSSSFDTLRADMLKDLEQIRQQADRGFAQKLYKDTENVFDPSPAPNYSNSRPASTTTFTSRTKTNSSSSTTLQSCGNDAEEEEVLEEERRKSQRRRTKRKPINPYRQTDNFN